MVAAVTEQLIDALLPQTQCRKCGYAGCRPYAGAIARGEADINQCPPGGHNTIRQLALLLGREIKPLNPAFGKSGPKTVAFIDENECIGCVKCIRACPVDAIIGASQQMHTVIAELCTGCELCLPPCPVDCISMLPVTITVNHDGEKIRRDADDARRRFVARSARLARQAEEQNQKKNPVPREEADDKQKFIEAAVARTRAKRERLKNIFDRRDKDE